MRAIVSLRNYLLLAIAVATVAAIPLSEQLEFDQRIESFFADDNPDLQLLTNSRKIFGGDRENHAGGEARVRGADVEELFGGGARDFEGPVRLSRAAVGGSAEVLLRANVEGARLRGDLDDCSGNRVPLVVGDTPPSGGAL